MGKSFKPYVGLRPFQDNESLIFFGREKQTLELLQRLHHHNFVAVVGTSGCGKSSLIRAGLIPALKGGYLVEESDSWCIAKMKPGGKPLYNLAESINEQVQLLDPDKERISHDVFLERIEEDGVDAILEFIAPLRKKKHINFFLLIDQFEELFDFAKKEPKSKHKNEAAGLVNLMLELSNQSEIPFYVVMTMRSDFIGDCTEYFRLPEALNESQYLVPRLTRSQLRQVIEGPAKLSNLKFDPLLTSKLLNEVTKFQDELPVLQHALLRMWQNEVNKDKDGTIDFKDYDAIGGLNKALSQDANQAYKSLTPKDKEIAKKIFKTLTTIDANGRKIRRRIQLKDLIEVCEVTKADIGRVINVFIENDRSFIIYYDKKGLDQIIDISHESLIRQWDSLGNWVSEEYENVAFYKELTNARKDYENRSRSLLDNVTLTRIKKNFESFTPSAQWAKKVDDDFSATMDFIQKSKKRSNIKRIGLYALIVLIPALGLYYIESKKTTELKNNLESEVNSLIRKGPPEFLETYLIINDSSMYKDTIQDVFLNRLLESITLDSLVVITESDSLKKVKFLEEKTLNARRKFIDTLSFFENARQYVKTINDSLKKSKGEVVIEITEEDLAWNRTKDKNTYKAYFDYLINPEFIDKKRKDSALTYIKKTGSKGWVFAGRKNGNGTQINDRVFNLVYRIGEEEELSQNIMLKKNDFVVLKDDVNRFIIESPSNDKKIKDAIIKSKDYYLIDELTTMGDAIYLHILYDDLLRIERLVQDIDDKVKSKRTVSLNQLISDFNNNGTAVDKILDLFDDKIINELSAQGRINAIFFLNRTTDNAWSKSRVDRATKIINKWKERHNSGQAVIGPQTSERIDELIRRLNLIKIKRI